MMHVLLGALRCCQHLDLHEYVLLEGVCLQR